MINLYHPPVEQNTFSRTGFWLTKRAIFWLMLGSASMVGAAVVPPGSTITNTASSSQQLGAAAQSSTTNAVTVAVGSVTLASLTKSFAAATIPSGATTPLVFRLTNSTGNPVQTGIAFVDTLPSGLRLTTGATSTVTGAGCSATVTLTAPSTISVAAGMMNTGTASCEIVVNGVTNTAAANVDCSTNPTAFTNGQTSITGLTNASNGVTNQCLVVTPPPPPTLTKAFGAASIFAGASTPVNFRLTNSAGNPAQSGIAFVDSLPSGLRLTTSATASFVGTGCTGTVTLTAPSTITVSGATMSTGAAICDVAVNGVTNTSAANADCAANPPAFTNGPTSISGLVNASNAVTNQCLLVTTLPTPILTKAFGAASILAGASTPLSFRLTNATGNPAQAGIAFVDTLPSGLRLTTGATATVTGTGCSATVTLTAPSSISVSAGTMSVGTVSCEIAVNGITNTAAANLDCTANPAAFTNGSSSISGLANASNGVSNQCLVVTPPLPTLTKTFGAASIPAGASTPLNFRLTNSTGNPVQSGITFVDTLPSGLRLTAGAAATVTGTGCSATVTLTAPSTINVSAGAIGAGTASCDIVVNGITNTPAANSNADCTTNPAAFTNGQSSISGLTNVSNAVSNQCLLVTSLATPPPTLTKTFGAASILVGGVSPVKFRLTNSTGNPVQSGISFVDTLPSGLRLSTGATANVTGTGCTATVTLVAPSTIGVTAGSMSAGSAGCDIEVNGVTNAAAGNPSCATNPAAFTNGPTSISGLSNALNNVTNQCLVISPTISILATPVCVGNTPYVDYSVVVVGASPPAGVNLAIQKTSGQAVSTLSNLPLSGRLLWPGASVDGTGNPTSWPGWVFDGTVYRAVNDGLRPDLKIIFTTDSSTTVIVNYPSSSGSCDPNPPIAPPAKPNLDVTLIKWLNQNYGVSPSGPYRVTMRYANTSNIAGAKTGVRVSDALPVGMSLVPDSLSVTSASDDETPLRANREGRTVKMIGTSGAATVNGVPVNYEASARSVAVVFSTSKPGDQGFIEFDVNIAPGIPVDTVVQNTGFVQWLDSTGEAGRPFVSNTVDFKITGAEAVTLTGMTLPSVDPGSTAVFENVLVNRTGRTDTFDISLSGSTYPQGTVLKIYKSDGVTLLADTNGNGIADTGPVAAGATYRIIVKVTIPVLTLEGGPYSVLKTAQSISNPLVRAADNDVVSTISKLCRVVLEPNNTGRVAPGGSLTYSHVLTNLGNCTETITIPSNYLTGNGVQGWTARAFLDNPIAGGQSIIGVLDPTDSELNTAMTFTLAPGTRVLFENRVTAPVNAVNGDTNTTTLRINTSGTGQLSVNDVTTVAVGSIGDITDRIVGYIDPSFLRPSVWGFIGKTLYLRAEAPSCNANPLIIERRTVIITGANGEREEIIAIETGPDTGVFIADTLLVRLPPVVAGDNILEGVAFEWFDVEILGCGRKITTTITLIDPNGIVFDSRTNEPVAGATVRIVNATGGVCSNTLSTVSQLITGQVRSAPNPVITGIDGRFTFELVPPGDYCVQVTTPNGYTWTSRVAASQLPGGRNILSTGPTSGGSYGGAFRVGPETGPVIVDIPVDSGLIGGLFVQKTAQRAVVEIGEMLDYSVSVNNKTGFALDLSDVFLTDTLPPGFSYIPGSARREGKPLADPQGGSGPRLVFNLGRMKRDQTIAVTYRVRVGPGAMQGDGINRVIASYRLGAANIGPGSGLPGSGNGLYSESNMATAKVDIVGGVFSDRAYIVGKVFADCNADGVQRSDGTDGPNERGIPGVRVYLEDGTSAISDSEGKYSFYGLLAKTHVLKVDRTTMPEGVEARDFVLLSNRNLGKGDSRFVDLKNGELQKANFAIKACSEKVVAEIDQRRKAAASLKSEVEGRLQQKLETDPNLVRSQGDVRALPASGQVGNTAPTVNIAAPAALGTTAASPENTQSATPTTRFETLATPLSAPAPKKRDQPAREPAIDLEVLLPNEDSNLGFIGLKAGDVLPYAQTTIRVKGNAGTTFKLKVNDKLIGDDRVGKKAVFIEKNLQAWEYFGVDLGVGENTLVVSQFDEFGNARGEKSIKVMAPGALANVKISYKDGKSEGAIADGKTAARIVVSLFDKNNVPVTSRVAITLSTSSGRWTTEDLNPLEPGLQSFVEGGRAEFELMPPSEPGQALIRVSSGEIKGEFKLDFLPDLRDLIAVGVIEGVLNLRKLDARGVTPVRAQDGFEQEITHIARTWVSGENKRDASARAAMFLKGKVLGEYLLTMAYDSDKNTKERLFRDIQPDEFYPIYGDSSIRAFDAQSTGRFYIRVDNKKSYLLYGDFNTSQATNARKLTNYSRSLTGIKQHYENSRISATAFASRDTTTQIIDEFAANGTSGPFALSRVTGRLNSEKIEILTRDRNQRAIILRAQPLARFSDYEIESLTGRILLKAPVPSLDENLNPISLRITYEVDQGGEQFWIAGIDGQVKVTDAIEVGAVFVDDRNPLSQFRMMGVNAIAKLADKTFLIAEMGRTRRDATISALPVDTLNALSPGEKTGDAKRIEFQHSGPNLEANFYAARADANFDNTSSSLTRGRQEIGGKLSYRFDQLTRVKGELLRTEDIVSGDKRDGLLLSVERTLGNGIRVEAGVRHAKESQSSAPLAAGGVVAPNEVTSVRVRVTGDLPIVKNASAYVEAEVDVQDSARKIAAVGADYKLGEAGRLYARHEFISSLTGPYGLNNQQQQNSTVVGINSEYMKDGNLFSEYRVRDAISGGDAEAALGLRNMWTIADGLKLQTGFERVHAIAGRGTGEATAYTLGVEYSANPLWKGSTRLEVRDGSSSDSILATVAAASKLSRDWTFLGRNTYSSQKNKSQDGGQGAGENEQNRLQLGVAYRDTDTDTWNALARVEHRSESDTTNKEFSLKRSVELISLHANWQPRRPFTFSARIAAKWTNENSNGISSKNNAQLISGRAIWEFAPRWDAALNLSTMLGNGGRSKYYGAGVELGFMVMENLWLSAGYNFFGYDDKDLTAAEYTSKGAFVRMRYKFDEDLFASKKTNKTETATPTSAKP